MKNRLIVLFIFSICSLTIGQLTNVWKGATDWEFNRGLNPAGDGYVIGKIAISEQGELFRNIGVLENVLPEVEPKGKDLVEFRKSWNTSYSNKAYFEKQSIGKTSGYYSRFAVNGFFYSLGNKVLKPDPHFYINFIYFQKSLLLSLILSLLVVWVSKSTSIAGGVVLLISLVFSPVITLMGGSLYFAGAIFFLPFVIPLYYLYKEHNYGFKLTYKHLLISSLAFLVNLLYHTFEMITAIGLSSVMPFVLYGLLSKEYKKAIVRMLSVGILNFIFIVLMAGGIVVQYSIAKKVSYVQGVEFVKSKFQKRSNTKGIEKKFKRLHPHLIDAQNAAHSKVIAMALDSPAVAINGDRKPILGLKYSGLLIFYLICGLVALFLNRSAKSKSLAYIFAWIISMSVPLSWLILFKPHAYLHMHFIVFTWYIPVIVFGSLIVGHLFGTITTLIRNT